MIQQLFTGYDDGDIDTNASANPHLNDLIAQRYSRRDTLRGGLSAMTTAVFGGMLLAACDDDDGGALGGVTAVTAGGSGTVTAGNTVTLTGGVTGAAVTSGFAQTGGPAVTLNNAGTASASFLAPGVAAPTAFTFTFGATGNDGKTQQATTTVTVNPATLGFNAVAKSLSPTR